MIQLSRKMEYTLMALRYMASTKPGTLVSAKEISSHYQVPFEVVARCLQKLAQKGLVLSMSGAAGGYQLNRSWENLSLLDLHEILEGKTQLVRCLEASNRCEYAQKCNLIDPISKINDQMRQFYRSINLGKVLLEASA
jgi:Rrf2 family protein